MLIINDEISKNYAKPVQESWLGDNWWKVLLGVGAGAVALSPEARNAVGQMASNAGAGIANLFHGGGQMWKNATTAFGNQTAKLQGNPNENKIFGATSPYSNTAGSNANPTAGNPNAGNQQTKLNDSLYGKFRDTTFSGIKDSITGAMNSVSVTGTKIMDFFKNIGNDAKRQTDYLPEYTIKAQKEYDAAVAANKQISPEKFDLFKKSGVVTKDDGDVAYNARQNIMNGKQ